MTKLSVVLTRVLLFAGAFSVATAQTSGNMLDSVRLLTPKTGWAATAHNLFWSDDGGVTWTDIAPKASPSARILDVFFLDASTGWVLVASSDHGFELASTRTSGTTWSLVPLSISGYEKGGMVLDGGAFLDFVDPLHGWINLSLVSGSNFRRGVLFATGDGGKTWTRTASDPGFAGSVRFNNTKDGWLAGGPGDQKLFVTHDGAGSWQEIGPQVTAMVNTPLHPIYHPPIFRDDRNGVLPITYSDGSGSSFLTTFVTNDGGKTWNQGRTINVVGGVIAFAGTDTQGIAATVQDHTHLTLNVIEANRGVAQRTATLPFSDFSVSNLSLADSIHGWALVSRGYCKEFKTGCVQERKLIATNDGGQSWREATPRGTSATQIISPLEFTAPSARVGQTGTTHISTNLGFDACAFQGATSVMQPWWKNSPYFDLGVYIGGVDMACPPSPDAPWVASVAAQGWGIMPLWVGPQAPCSGLKNPIDTSHPKDEGVSEALAAKTRAAMLGLGPIVYYDMEIYSSANKECGQTVTDFLSGWTQEMHQNDQYGSFLSGVYGEPSNASKDFARSSPIADDVWIHNSNGKATVWNMGLPQTLWPNQQRIHQYWTKKNYTQTWGGVAISPDIDQDIEDAPVTGGDGQSKSYTFTSFFYQNAIRTSGLGINNAGVVVGLVEDANKAFHGFQYANGSFQLFDFSGTATYTESHGINNSGVMVGCYSDAAGVYHAFVGPLGQLTSFDYPGAIYTCAKSINDHGLVAGYFWDATGNTHGFIKNNNSFTQIDYKGKRLDPTFLSGINNNGLAVGSYVDASGKSHGFSYDGTKYTTIDYPDAGKIGTVAYGVNDAGLIVGEYFDAWGPNGFLLSNKNFFTYVAPPGGGWSGTSGINSNGQMTGAYSPNLPGEANSLGFLATPQQ